MLPALQTLFLEKTPPSGPVQEAIKEFVAVRQLSSHRVPDCHSDREDEESFYDTDDEPYETDDESSHETDI